MCLVVIQSSFDVCLYCVSAESGTGVGIYLWLNGEMEPGEEEQFVAYRDAARFGGAWLKARGANATPELLEVFEVSQYGREPDANDLAWFGYGAKA